MLKRKIYNELLNSTKRYTTISLNKFSSKYSAHLSTLDVLHTADYKADNGIEYLPVYMAGLL